MKIGYLRGDDDHQYVIPEEDLKLFKSYLLEMEMEPYNYILSSNFDNMFGEFIVEGELYNMKIIMEE